MDSSLTATHVQYNIRKKHGLYTPVALFAQPRTRPAFPARGRREGCPEAGFARMRYLLPFWGFGVTVPLNAGARQRLSNLF